MNSSFKKIASELLRGITYLLLTIFFRGFTFLLTLIVAIFFSAAPDDSFVATIFPFFMFLCFLAGGILTTVIVTSIRFLSPISPKLQKVRLISFILIYLLTGVAVAGSGNIKSLSYILPADILSVGGTLYVTYKFRKKFV